MRASTFPFIPLHWLRTGLIIGQLVLSAALVFVGSQRLFMLGIVLLVGAGMALSFLRWPALGLAVAATAGLVVPFIGPSGLNVTMILVALLLGLWLLDMMIRQRQIRLAPSRTLWPLFSFALIAFLSFAVGQLPWFTFALHAPLGAQLGGLSIIVLSAATFLLMANQVKEISWLKLVTWAFLIVATLSIFFRSVLPGVGIYWTQRYFQSVGSVFYVWVVSIAFSQATLNRELHKGWRLALGALVLVTLWVLFVLKFADKSGWIPCLVCIAAITGLRSWRAGLLMILATVGFGVYQSTVIITSEDYSIATRFDAWLILAQIVKMSPLWGLGFANYYWYTPLFPIRGYAVSFNSHNNYVDIVAQTGVIGLVCYLWLLWEIGRLAWRLRERAPAGFTQAYVYGALGGLVGMALLGMLGDWVLPFFYNIGLIGFRGSMVGWLFLGGLVSLEQMINRPPAPASANRPGMRGLTSGR